MRPIVAASEPAGLLPLLFRPSTTRLHQHHHEHDHHRDHLPSTAVVLHPIGTSQKISYFICIL